MKMCKVFQWRGSDDRRSLYQQSRFYLGGPSYSDRVQRSTTLGVLGNFDRRLSQCHNHYGGLMVFDGEVALAIDLLINGQDL